MPQYNLADFFHQFKLLFYKKHEVILRADTFPHGVSYLQKGYVRDYAISRNGEELSLIIFKPGDFFPLQWALNDKHEAHNLEAMTPVELYRAPKEQFTSYLRQHPEVFLNSTYEIVTRMGGLMDRMEHLVFGNAYERVASILYILAERFGHKDKSTMIIPIPLAHRSIAALVGMTRETVSVEMKKLQEKDIIRADGRFIHITDMDKLQKESLIE